MNLQQSLRVGICLYERGCICLDSLVLRVRYWGAGIAKRSYVTLYSIIRRLSLRLWSRGRQFRSFSSDAGSVSIISIHPPGSPPLDGFHFQYSSGNVGDHTVEPYSNCGLTSVLYDTDFRSLLWT